MRFENTNVYNFEGSLRGMRNPMNSWISQIVSLVLLIYMMVML